MHRRRALAFAILVSLPAVTPARAGTPQLDRMRPILCMDDPAGRRVRVQCDAPESGGTTCLFTPACRGNPCEELERVGWCSEAGDGERWADLAGKGYSFVPARADTPAGFYRDEEGRAFQVNFDLNDRLWLGGSYLHTFSEDSRERDGVLLELGLRAELLNDDHRSRSRFRFLEVSLVPAPLEIEASLLRFDSSSAGDKPFVRITTFIGGPARHDLYLAGGWWLDLLGVEHRPRGSTLDTNVRIVGGGVTWDLWQDADMTSYLRVKLGVGLDDDIRDGQARFCAAPLVALEGDVTFDDEGFHHLVLSSRFEAAFIQRADEEGFDYHRRFESELAYELILIAIDDQPLTLRAGVSGGYRDDLAEGNGWALALAAGLRFSLWAPPRDLAARDAIIAGRNGRAP